MLGLINSDALHIPLADNSVQCVVTSPPYYGLRDYGTAIWKGGDPNCDHLVNLLSSDKSTLHPNPEKKKMKTGIPYKDICGKCGAARKDGQLGLEQSPEKYVEKMVGVFREVWRVLRDDGTLWLNMGDSYAGSGKGQGGKGTTSAKQLTNYGSYHGEIVIDCGLAQKQLLGIPWRLAFALQADGWYLRSDIIWHKPNPMPESVRDRPTKSHEYLFLLSKSQHYYYDAEAIKEPWTDKNKIDIERAGKFIRYDGKWKNDEGNRTVVVGDPNNGRNRRSVWTIPTAPYKGAHFATYPPALVEPCIKAGTSEAGCCPKCGKPWIRKIKKTTNTKLRKLAGKHEGEYQRGRVTSRNSEYGDFHDLGTVNIIDDGFYPSCTCENIFGKDDPIPCIIFDPFAGSGTTLLVARQLGRHGIGCDLSFTYLHDQARKRLELDKLEAWIR